MRFECRIYDVRGRRRYPARHLDQQHIEAADGLISKRDLLISGVWLQDSIEVLLQNSAAMEILTKHLIGQIWITTQEELPLANRFLEVEFFEPVQRIVMHECPHGPVIGDDLACQSDQSS